MHIGDDAGGIVDPVQTKQPPAARLGLQRPDRLRHARDRRSIFAGGRRERAQIPSEDARALRATPDICGARRINRTTRLDRAALDHSLAVKDVENAMRRGKRLVCDIAAPISVVKVAEMISHGFVRTPVRAPQSFPDS